MVLTVWYGAVLLGCGGTFLRLRCFSFVCGLSRGCISLTVLVVVIPLRSLASDCVLCGEGDGGEFYHTCVWIRVSGRNYLVCMCVVVEYGISLCHLRVYSCVFVLVCHDVWSGQHGFLGVR